ncbi:MAG: MFS transporter [Candidatus Ancaeobacter aquaticus]|nr:MFS transporter [Candidatus Ancaeobacter aquaticus]
MKKLPFFILLMAGFSAMLGLGIISPFLPEFSERHDANGFWMGMIFAGFGISRGIIMPFVGKMSDKRGRKIFVASGLLLYAVISCFYPYTDSVFQLTLVRVIHGFSAGLIIPIVMAYVGDIATEGKESIVTGTLNMMFCLGLATGPLFGGILFKLYGTHAVFYMMSGLGVLNFLIVVFFLPDCKNVELAPPENPSDFHSLIKYNFIKAILIITVIITLIMVVFMSFLPSLAENIHVDASHVGIILSTGVLLAGILQIPFGWVADKLDRVEKLIQIGVGTTISMFALVGMPFCPDFIALFFVGAFLGVGLAIALPPLTSLSVGIGKKTSMGAWMGIFNAARSISFVIAPILFGIIMDFIGINYVFYLSALVVFFGALSFGHYIRKRLKGYKTG